MKFPRKISTVFAKYDEILNHEHEKKVNSRINKLSKNGTVISIIPSKIGMKPQLMTYTLTYEDGNPSEHKYHRYLKTVLTTINEMQPNENGEEENIDKRVNAEVDRICSKGGKVIAILHNTFGFSPVIVLYDIIYEAEKCVDDIDTDTEKADATSSE